MFKSVFPNYFPTFLVKKLNVCLKSCFCVWVECNLNDKIRLLLQHKKAIIKSLSSKHVLFISWSPCSVLAYLGRLVNLSNESFSEPLAAS